MTVLFIIMTMMSITLKEFFIGQKVYAQTSIPKPVIDNSSPNQAELQNTLNELQQAQNQNNITQADQQSTLSNVQQAQQELNNKKQDAECKKNLPWSTRDVSKSSCTCEKGLALDKLECRQECPNGYTERNGVKQNECLINTAGNLGINCDPAQLINGTCTWNINKTLGIRGSDTTPSPTILLQDIVLAATSFVGTLIMIALIVMGIKYVKGGFDESATGDLKGNIKKLLIGLFLIIGSYTIIRLIQYVARGY